MSISQKNYYYIISINNEFKGSVNFTLGIFFFYTDSDDALRLLKYTKSLQVYY